MMTHLALLSHSKKKAELAEEGALIAETKKKAKSLHKLAGHK